MTATDYALILALAGFVLVLLVGAVVDVHKALWRAYRRHRGIPEPWWEAPALRALAICVGMTGGVLVGLALGPLAGLSPWVGAGAGVVLGGAAGGRRAAKYAERAAKAKLAGLGGAE